MVDQKEERLGRDVFLALAAMGWADGKLDQDEADAIVRTALEEGLELGEIAEIEEAIKEPVMLERLDLSTMSKADRLFVYAVATWMARLDGVVHTSEAETLQKLGALLRIPERPRELAEALVQEVGDASESQQPSFYDLPKLRATLKRRLSVAQQLRAAQKAAQAGGDDALGPEPGDEGKGS
jgi:uncharacterized membrane protein YebE (DUF533 family)